MKVFLIAGEPSGDRLGAALMAGLRQLVPGVEFAGVGGPLMQAQGMVSQFPMEELSVMGIAEVLPKYFHLKRRVRETAEAALAWGPDVMISIDSPDFCLRVAKLVKAASKISTVHYVAPSVWAWRPGRARKMARHIDHVLAILPFEPPYMQAAGMSCDFVGHPVATEPVATAAEVARFRADMGLADAPYVLALPGSRRSEVAKLAPVFGPALKAFLQDNPEFRVVLPAAGPVAEALKDHLGDWPEGTVLLDPNGVDAETALARKRAAFAGADLALAASGTVSLELAANATPMVVAYTFKPLTWAIMKRMALIDTVTLVNLVSDTRVVPECLGPDCTADNIAAHLSDLRANPAAQGAAMAKTMREIGKDGEDPGLRAARSVLGFLQRG